MNRTKRYKTWLKVTAECVWCGNDFFYFTPLDEAGNRKRVVRFCTKKCVAEYRWEGKHKLPDGKVLVDLYVLKSMSIQSIATKFGAATSSVSRVLRLAGCPMREHTSTRTCIVLGCKLRAHKIMGRNKYGKCLYGRRCLEHQRDLYRTYSRTQALKNPNRGLHPPGRLPIPRPCLTCGVICKTTRESRVHCSKKAV